MNVKKVSGPRRGTSTASNTTDAPHLPFGDHTTRTHDKRDQSRGVDATRTTTEGIRSDRGQHKTG